MRARLISALLALSLVPALVTAGAAAADPKGPGLPEQASPTAQAAAGAALERAREAFAPASQAARGAERPDATLALNQLMRVRDDLRGRERAEADALLARPTGNPAWANEPQYSGGNVQSFCPSGSVICVHYTTTGSDRVPAGDSSGVTGVPDWVEATAAEAQDVHETYVDAGYRRPDGDGSLGGGSNKVDVYLLDLGDSGIYGYCTSDQPTKNDGTFNYWAYCAIDNDFASAQFPTNTPAQNRAVTLAHEYFHAVQYAYDAWEDVWFLEATATWAEDELFDGVNDSRQYLPYGQLIRSGTPLDKYDGGLSVYGQWIFFRYLTERWSATSGGLPVIMRDLVEEVSARAGDPDYFSIQALQRVLGQRNTSLAATYASFADVNRRPAMAYDEGSAYPVASQYRTHTLTKGKRKSGWKALTQNHLTSRTIRFVPGSGTTALNWKIRLKLDMANKSRGTFARVTTYWKSGSLTRRVVKLGSDGNGKLVTGFSRQKVTYVELVLVNASGRYTGCWSGNPTYACEGRSRDDGLRQRYLGVAFRG
jgi:hypothetical protein